jgi:hypothetical protein
MGSAAVLLVSANVVWPAEQQYALSCRFVKAEILKPVNTRRSGLISLTGQFSFKSCRQHTKPTPTKQL